MHIKTNPKLNRYFKPLIMLCEWLGINHPVVLAYIRYFARFKKCLNIKNPKTLNEKILYLSLKTDTTLWTRCADKYSVREYVKEKGLGNILVPLIGVWEKAEDIDFVEMPNQFVLKTNHGCGDVLVVKDKSLLDTKATIDSFSKELKHSYGALESAHHYLRIKPLLIAEGLLQNDNEQNRLSTSMIDYKIWCFNGRVAYIMTCSNRQVHNGHETVVLKLYDRDWNSHSEFMIYDNDHIDGPDLPLPQHYNDMISIAEKLAEPFPCVRVDLYNISGKIFFSELTFTSYGGLMNYYTDEFQLMAGKQVDLSGVKTIK